MSPRKKAGAETALVPIDQRRALPEKFREKFAAFRKKQSASTPGPAGMPTVRAANGQFTFPGSSQATERFRGVVLCALRANAFWEGRYVAGSEDPPVCVAMAKYGEHENTMRPMEGTPKPQSETCATCAQNVAPQKACRNGLHVAVLHESSLADVKTAVIGRLRISSTGIGPFGAVDRQLADQGEPLFGALLEFWQEQPEGSSYFTTRCAPVSWLPPEVVDQLSERVEEAAEELWRAGQPVPQASEAAESGAPAPLPPRRKKAAKKGGRRL
jgi:hypothetical protein